MTNTYTFTQDYSIHGIVNIQTIGLSDETVHWLERFRTSVAAQADIQIQAVDSLRDKPLHYIALHEHGYSESGFMVLTKEKSPKRLMIPLENLGAACSLTCERGINSIPMLEEVIHLTAIGKGMLPLHAAAFEHQQQNIVVSGWPQGGKTSLLLAFTRHGARYISDDWLYLNPGQQILGIPLPVTLRSWQIEQLPQIRADLSLRKQLRLQTIKHFRSLADAVTQPIFPRSFTKLTGKVRSLLDARSNITILPEELFGADLSTTGSRIDKILLPISYDSPEIYVEAVSSEEGLAHLHQIQMYEWQPLLSAYHAYCVAMPEKHNAFLERLSEHLRELIYLRLRDVPIYRVYHPHPVDLDALYQIILPYTK